jgi:hypothetical protein
VITAADFQRKNILKFISEDFLTFSNFKKFMDKNDWQNKTLTRELHSIDNTYYSTDTCHFVCDDVLALVKRKSFASDYVGLFYDARQDKFRATIFFRGKRIYCGTYKKADDARKAYFLKKSELLTLVAEKEKNQRNKKALFNMAEVYFDKSKENKNENI